MASIHSRVLEFQEYYMGVFRYDSGGLLIEVKAREGSTLMSHETVSNLCTEEVLSIQYLGKSYDSIQEVPYE